MKTVSLKTTAGIAAALLLAGCKTGPQPFDGDVGYTLTRTDTGCSVEYVEEVHDSYAHLERHARKLCGETLHVPARTLATRVTVDQAFSKEVQSQIVLPTPGTPNAPAAPSGSGVNYSTPGTERQYVLRTLMLQRVVVEVAPAAP